MRHEKRTWRFVEFHVIKPRRPWCRKEAVAFNEWLSALDGHPAKAVIFDIHGGRYLGYHNDAIHMRAIPFDHRRDANLWRVFLHELAHYRVKHHKKAFVVEYIRIYRLWRSFPRLRKLGLEEHPVVPAS